eukprot:4057513-Pleurochrysis_carterae.AAC.1
MNYPGRARTEFGGLGNIRTRLVAILRYKAQRSAEAVYGGRYPATSGRCVFEMFSSVDTYRARQFTHLP